MSQNGILCSLVMALALLLSPVVRVLRPVIKRSTQLLLVRLRSYFSFDFNYFNLKGYTNESMILCKKFYTNNLTKDSKLVLFFQKILFNLLIIFMNFFRQITC
jgi:hypothetical protein